MLLEHQGKRPQIDPSAYIAPTAVICGDVTVGPNCQILFGAVLTAETGPVVLGEHCIVMENAVLRGTKEHPLRLGNHVLVGPQAHLTGCQVADNAFVATGSSVFNGAQLGEGASVYIGGVVHVKTKLPPRAVVPIGWVAVGDPAEILPPEAAEQIGAQLKALNFGGTVFGLERPAAGSVMPDLTTRYGRALARHRADRVLDPEESEG